MTINDIKDFGWLILLAVIAGLAYILLGGKPKWVEEKEKVIYKRKEKIPKEQKEADNAAESTETLIKENDEEIKNSTTKLNKMEEKHNEIISDLDKEVEESREENSSPIDNNTDASQSIDDILSDIK